MTKTFDKRRSKKEVITMADELANKLPTDMKEEKSDPATELIELSQKMAESRQIDETWEKLYQRAVRANEADKMKQGDETWEELYQRTAHASGEMTLHQRDKTWEELYQSAVRANEAGQKKQRDETWEELYQVY
ncbi:hypothetical protein PMAYCL1PPCAC_19555 [Pristionchus mayeri]|uniref:Uncharacterized protein n=1 Tax=Pristionchus mayeri TaxID=1317129 RepID=A0AAN5CS03_9BILA|nr:hypothetical protein PMAYCL1PPCAC_19555 [Pristionchus mayeri]